MMESIRQINKDVVEEISVYSSNSEKVLVISSFFDPAKKGLIPEKNMRLSKDSQSILTEACRILEYGGLLFVYGIPSELWLWAEYLISLKDQDKKMVFKYWIALDIDKRSREDYLLPTHQGILMFLKSKATTQNLSPFKLNTNEARIPYKYCKSCKENVKDWGGKKHLMNPRGACVSDVWKDLPRVRIQDNIIPDSALQRIIDLTVKEDRSEILHVIQTKKAVTVKEYSEDYDFKSETLNWDDLSQIEANTVYEGDCISFLHRTSNIYPEGLFDLVFADPPYNLNKAYSNYDDERADKEYVDWCNAWLYGMYRTLKPGGALFVVNLPKWAIPHAAFLGQYMDFRHWIVWDALSEPRGKIMPAHYTLLYYTRPGGSAKFNYSPLNSTMIQGTVLPPDSLDYCLRAKCIQSRKLAGDDDKAELSDIWSDLHRIKHKRDRDSHPCQLPDSLMERIILLATNQGDLVFDPFAGAGTTALAALKLNRRYVTIDIDHKYVEITNHKIREMNNHRNLFGIAELPRKSLRRRKKTASKKDVEVYLQHLARKLGKVPTEFDIQADRPSMINKIDILYPNRGAAIKRCKVALA